jgi:methyl-accepting chemotaxis protein
MLDGLKFRIPAVNVGLALVSVATMAFLSWQTAQSGLIGAAKDRLQFAATARKSSVEQIFDRVQSDLSYLAANSNVASNFSDLAENLDPASPEFAKIIEAFTSPKSAGERLALDGHEQGTMYGRRHFKLHESVRKLLEHPGYADVLLLDDKDRIIYTATKSGDFSHVLSEPALQTTGLARLIERMKKAGDNAILYEDFAAYPVDSAPSAFLAKPMTRRANAAMGTAQADIRIGYIVLRLDPKLLGVLAQREGLGDTGQIFATGADKLLRSQPPLDAAVTPGRAVGDLGLSNADLATGAPFQYAPATGGNHIAATAGLDVLGAHWTLIAEQSTDEALHAVNSLKHTLLWSSLIIVALTVVAGIVMAGSIVKPILGIAQRMQRLSAGAVGEPVDGQKRRDEIGIMARAVQVFKDNALALRQSQAEAVEQRRLQEEERARSEAVRAKAAEDVNNVVTAVAQGLSHLANGDLTFNLSAAFPPDYEKLRADFNEAMDQLRETIRLVASNTESMRSGTGEISQTSSDLARRTAQQASSLEHVANSLNQVTATVRKTAESAEQARAVVTAAKSEAEQSGRVVQNTVAAMSEIEKSSGQINQIIGVIDEIAFQTSLLALNAGVEAARAGDAGRGFAVVASEVRGLSQRSAEAAKEIKTLISASAMQVAAGVALVGETGRALARISAQVVEINGVVSNIAAAAKEQAAGLAEVNTAMSDMDQVTQQNAAMVEEATEANQALASEADGLSTLVGRFRTGEEKKRPSHAPARPAPMPVQSPSRGPASRTGNTATAMRTVSQTTPAEQSWDEF